MMQLSVSALDSFDWRGLVMSVSQILATKACGLVLKDLRSQTEVSARFKSIFTGLFPSHPSLCGMRRVTVIQC